VMVLQVESEYHCKELVNFVLEVIINCFLKATVPVGTPIRVRAVLLSIHPPLGSAPDQLILYNPVHSCPDACVSVPEAVVPVPVAGIAVAVLLSSFFAHELIAKVKKAIRIICKIFFIFSSKFEMFIKFEKSHIHILESETLSREYRVTESAQEIIESNPYI